MVKLQWREVRRGEKRDGMPTEFYRSAVGLKNYYQILNVRPTATEADIKRSYRVLAKRYHPDVNPGDAAAADKFADINEANAVLSDPKTRAEYDAKLQESASARLNPEDIIAKQRAQAQAAARQAAYRNGGSASAAAARAKQAAQAAQAQAMRNAQAAAAAAAAAARGGTAAYNAQLQLKIQAIRDQAYRSGREHGVAEVRAAAEAEINKMNATLRAMNEENKRLKKRLDEATATKQQLADAERDRRELEQELFNRDRELSQEKLHAKDIEEQLQSLRASGAGSRAEVKDLKSRYNTLNAECEKLRAEAAKAQSEIASLKEDNASLKSELAKADLTNKSQIQLQQEKRRQMQEEIDELNRQLGELNTAMDDLRSENEQWQQYAQSEQFLTDADRRIEEWNKKLKVDRRLAKSTLYGTLGVLIWATDAEIEEAYVKFKKRYSGKTDETIVAKLAKIEEAYEVLSDPARRADYNMSIEITEERIEQERKLIYENESLMEEYRSRLAGKEFWVHYDEVTAAALAGDAVAQNTLGEYLYYGDEVDRDFEQAVFWFKESAKQKHPDAMYHLGVCFINGEGVDKNKETGEGFIRQAAKLGSKDAQHYVTAAAKKAASAAKKKTST